MLTTQIQLLLYIGNIQVVSCSVFVPVPSIVVKSHQTLEAILPYLPLSLTAAEPEEQSGPDPLLHQPALPAPPTSDSHHQDFSLSLAAPATASSHSTALVPSTKQDIVSSHSSRSNSSAPSNQRRSSSNSNRISPDSSIPATTCIKISLQPTPSFKFVKPKCPHQHQKNRNRRHYQQEQQQQQQSSSHSHSHSHHSHSHSHSYSHSHHSHSRGTSHTHSHYRSDSRRRHSNHTTMASLEYPQQITSVINTVGETVTVKFIYLVPSSSTTTTLPGKVQVTGTFNAWQRSQPLSCSHDQTFFEADVPIDLDSLTQDMATSVNNKEQQDSNQKKILFKFILDDQNWVIDQDQPTERDFAGNLNNVLFIDHPVAPITTSHPAIPRDDVPEPSTPVPAAAAVVKQVEIEDETEEERAARLKQEAEDDETIRQLGGGMWGAPYFAVNDPIALPDHFSEVNSTGVNNTEEVATASTSLKAESETVTHDIVAEHADAVEAAQLAEKVAQKVVLQAPPATEWDNVESKEVNEDIIEDEDDKVIKELGGGMWGTPFFKVNDPTTLPEHIQTALAINAAAATTFASSNIATTDVEEVADKDIRIVKDEIATTIEGSKLIETVVETTEDTIIEAADGTFLEESITTSVESSISGVIDEAITETIETIEEVEATPSTEIIIEDEGAIEFVETIEEQTDNENNKVPARVSTPEVTMTETETLTSVQGEDGLQTTIIEDTLTFSEGPEVDSSSLHSLTTAVKPVNEGESVIVEQSPEFMISVAGSASAGDAKPSVDESVEPLPLPSATATNTTVPTSAIDSTHSTEKCQQDDEVVLLQSQKPQENAIVGDAKPTADQSANTTVITSTLTSTPAPIVVTKSTLPNHLLSDAPPAALTVASPDVQKEGKTEKSEKRKSFWKKVKKVLS